MPIVSRSTLPCAFDTFYPQCRTESCSATLIGIYPPLTTRATSSCLTFVGHAVACLVGSLYRLQQPLARGLDTIWLRSCLIEECRVGIHSAGALRPPSDLQPSEGMLKLSGVWPVAFGQHRSRQSPGPDQLR